MRGRRLLIRGCKHCPHFQSTSLQVEQSMEQLYSEALGKFLADRFVVGTCPKCKYEDARGDQCDACGNLLNPTELINPKCKFSGTKPVIRSDEGGLRGTYRPFT